MSLASRAPGNNAGSNHSGVTGSTKIAGATSNQFPAPTQAVAHQTSNQPNSSRCSSGALMSLLSSGLSVPRQMMVQARGAQDNHHIPIHLSFVGTIGQGTFGQIERATLTLPGVGSQSVSPEKVDSKNDSNQTTLQVAVKRVLQDPRYKNRELSIMQQLNNHPNVVKFYYYYYSTASSSGRSHRSGSGRSGSSSSGVDVFLHLVLECFPESLCELIYRYSQRNLRIPSYLVKVFTYQMLKALAYLHSHHICHRDIKSSNLLVNEGTAVLKVCDFGSAKEMVPGTANVSYISSRYYRAPELLFGAQFYTCAIDTWSGGCVLAEMLKQHCLFMGVDSVDQLVKVIRVLGTPTPHDISSMNPMYGSYNFPDVQSCPVKLFFPQHTPVDLLSLMSKMLLYNPTLRILPSQALSEPCFDELRELGPNGILPNRVRIPPNLFDPNPEPNPTTSSHDSSTTNTSFNYWPPSDPMHRRTSTNKKSSNAATDVGNLSDKKNKQMSSSRVTGTDWSRKGRSSGSDKSASAIQINEAVYPNGAVDDNQTEKSNRSGNSKNVSTNPELVDRLDSSEVNNNNNNNSNNNNNNNNNNTNNNDNNNPSSITHLENDTTSAALSNPHFKTYVCSGPNRANPTELHQQLGN